MNNYEVLKNAVLAKSSSDDFGEASDEWKVVSMYKSKDATAQCVCGQCNLKNLFLLKNAKTNEVLFPIGSSCVNFFGNEQMTKDVLTIKDVSEFRDNCFKDDSKITLDDLNNNIINYYFGLDAFNDDNDAEFLKKMFRKRNKNTITKKQWAKIYFILDDLRIAALLDSAFDSEYEKEKISEVKKEFLKKYENKYINAKDIPRTLVYSLPYSIFTDEEEFLFFIKMYEKEKKNYNNMTEAQKKYFISLLFKKVLPYLKK